MNNIGSIGFVGTVVGQLSFGYISDNFDRTGMLTARNVILCMCALFGGTGSRVFACLTVWRFSWALLLVLNIQLLQL